MDLEQEPQEVETEPSPSIEADSDGHGGGDIPAETLPSNEPPPRDRYDRDSARESEARYWREEAERNRRELEMLQAQQRQMPQESEDQLRDRLGPEGYILHQFDRSTNAFRQSTYASEMRTSGQLDQMRFEQELDRTQRGLGWSADKAQKFSSEIEQWYGNIARNAMQTGQPMMVSRIDLLDKIIGREMRTSGSKAVRAAADKGRQNISRQSAKMTNATSNMTGKSTGKSKAEESLQRMIDAGAVEL